jgi:hypothetical protein
MKKFVPGEIARAEDVNANFDELKQAIDALTNGLQTGQISVGSLQPGEQSNFYKVSFPKRFAKAPMVFMQSQNQRLNVAAWDITADGFTWMAHNNTSGASAFAQLMWLAVAI